MDRHIELTEVKNTYITIEEAKQMNGLRLVLGEYPIPGPWRESCKSIFFVKNIPYKSVRTSNEGCSDLMIGANNSQSELIELTGQSSAPVAMWNNERPRSTWVEQLNLAERLEPNPPLIPKDINERALMFGLINELAGENGLAWSQRLFMAHGPLTSLPENHESREFWNLLGSKHGYDEKIVASAKIRIIEVLQKFGELVDARKGDYLLPSGFSALDIYWACFIGLFKPMEPTKCPMGTDFRPVYSSDDVDVNNAISKKALAHRDLVYDRHLELPIVF